MNSILSAPGRTHHQPVSAPSKMAGVTDETLKSLKTLFSKRSLLQTKQFIEDDILGNRAPQDMPLDTYKSIWYKTIDSIKLAEKTGDEDQRTEAALRKIANTIKEYCKNNGDFWEASKKLPKVLRESKKVQKLLGTLFRNINRIADHASTVQSIEKVTKKTTTVAVQQTFPGWEDITINGKEPVFIFDDDAYPGGYTNVIKGKEEEARKWKPHV